MPINPKDAQLLKRPFGTLIPDKQITGHKVASMLKGAKKVISVGDATTERLASFGIIPDVAVIDGKERRSKRGYPANYQARVLQCANPASTISKEAVEVLQDALKARPPVRVLVDGEEDLLALPAFAMTPEGSVVLYGQPLEGMVVVKITSAKQRQAKDLMDRIMDNANLLESPSHNRVEEQKGPVGSSNKGKGTKRRKSLASS